VTGSQGMGGARVLVYAYDKVGRTMAGPGVRAVSIARELARAGAGRLEVALGLRFPPDEAPAGLDVRHPVRLRDLVAADLVVAQTLPTALLAPAIAAGARFVFDLYDPEIFERLEIHRDAPARERRRAAGRARASLAARLLAGEHFAAANERQRDLYLGALAALGRLRAASGRAGAEVASVAPFGFEDDAPPVPPGALKGKWPGIAAGDRVLIWGGGVWNWFDPLTAIRGVASLARARGRDDVKLFFLGTRNPNPEVKEMRTLTAAVEEARRLGLEGRAVVFHQGWVPHRERGAFYADADVGVSLHLPTLEARYAFRTRIVDYLWAGLPMVVSAGDTLGDEVGREGLGAAVPGGDPDAFERAVATLLFEPGRADEARARVARHRERYRWPVALAPLIEGVDRALAGEGLRPTRRDRLRALAALARGIAARVGP